MGRYDTNQNGQNEGVALVSSLYTRVDGAGGVTHETETHRRVTQTMMRPYDDPNKKPENRCEHGDCNGYKTRTGYCAGHSKSLGLTEGWANEAG